VAGDEAAVPTNDGRGPDDQEHLGEPSTVQRSGDRGEDRAVRFGEPGSGDLTLQDQDLVAEGEDLGVTLIASREQPAEAGHNEPGHGGDEVHEQATVPTGAAAHTPWNLKADEFSAPSGSFLGNAECTPGYYNNEGQPLGKEMLLNVAGYPAGPVAFFSYIDRWRSSGDYEGLEFR